MHTTAVLLRRHARTLAPGLLALSGAPQNLTVLNQAVALRVGEISPHHDLRHRADTLESLGRDLLPRLHRQHESLRASEGPHARGLRDSNLITGRNWSDLLAHGPRLMRREPDNRLLEANNTFAILLDQTAVTRALALAYAAAVAPHDREGLGIRLDAQSSHEVDRLWGGADRPPFLTRQAVLQLRDYVHPFTGSFNFYRAMDDLHTQYPQLELLHLLDNLPAQLTNAVRAAWAHPGLRGQAPVYRGLQPAHGMDLAPGTLLKLQRATSSAASPEGSYLGLCVHGVLYCIEIQLHDGPGGPVKGLLMPPLRAGTAGVAERRSAPVR